MAKSIAPAENDFGVTPHDTNPLPVGRGLYVGVTGNITGRLVGSTVDRVYKNIQQGVVHPLIFQYIRNTGTTATDMVVVF